MLQLFVKISPSRSASHFGESESLNKLLYVERISHDFSRGSKPFAPKTSFSVPGHLFDKLVKATYVGI